MIMHRADPAAVIRALRSAAPYIRLYKGKTFVVKAGGGVFGDAGATADPVVAGVDPFAEARVAHGEGRDRAAAAHQSHAIGGHRAQHHRFNPTDGSVNHRQPPTPPRLPPLH